MGQRRRRHQDPLTLLLMNIRAAAVGINAGGVRDVAARKADSIPQTFIERNGGGKAKIAKQARAIMRHLPTMAAEELPQAAKDLRACADALTSTFHVTSEIRLGERRRTYA